MTTKPTSPYVMALMSFSSGGLTLKEGDLVASSDPIVRKHRQMFVPADIDRETYRSTRWQRFEGVPFDENILANLPSLKSSKDAPAIPVDAPAAPSKAKGLTIPALAGKQTHWTR